jgi:23S rRNA (cytosine1962-C5)-methyltransferase
MTSHPIGAVPEVSITPTGVRRLRGGHLWIYAGDVAREPANPDAPVVKVSDPAGKPLGYAFYSKTSQIRLRVLSRDAEPPDRTFFVHGLRRAVQRRGARASGENSACRLVFGEADLLPSILVDRYGEYLVLQTLSKGADALKPLIAGILSDLLSPKGIYERNDVKARRLEGLEEQKGVITGSIPDSIEIDEAGIRFAIDLAHGQKTGFFLDQAENRVAARRYAAGRVLDCFTNTGGFALHFAPRCESVLALDVSADSLAQARRNAELNGIRNVEFQEGNVFDKLRQLEHSGEKFDLICLDPPAFAKNRAALTAARGGYKEINLRAMKLLKPEGILATASCSYHLLEADFHEVIVRASIDARRYIQVVERRSQAEDHPVLASMPETRYLKFFILRVM